jgi:hypothetical protein
MWGQRAQVQWALPQLVRELQMRLALQLFLSARTHLELSAALVRLKRAQVTVLVSAWVHLVQGMPEPSAPDFPTVLRLRCREVC